MSKERIAGERLDCEIAERVMGWERRPDGFWAVKGDSEGYGVYFTHDASDYDFHDFMPSGYIADAWQVVEAIRAKGWDVQIDSLGYTGEEWRTFFTRDGPLDESRTVVAADAATLPLSVCLAALNAIETAAQIEAATPAEAPLTESVSRSPFPIPQENKQ